MKAVMLDTNVVLDILKNRTKALNKLKEFEGYQFFISYLVYIEFMAGATLKQKKDARKFIQQFFTVKNFDTAAHTQATSYAGKYFVGRENKPMDLMIAAHAKALNIPIITNNAKDFIFKETKVYHYSKSFWI